MPKAHPESSVADDGLKSSSTPPQAARGQADPSDQLAPSPGPALGPRTEAAAERAGFVALIGRPNVGKSTLMNRILGEKLAIVSPKPQTTRTRLLGIKNLPGVQLALVDTPGMHRPDGRGRTLLNRYMVDEALTALTSVDVVLLVTDLDSQRVDKAAPRERSPGATAAGRATSPRAISVPGRTRSTSTRAQ